MSNLSGNRPLVHARPFVRTRVAIQTSGWSRRRAIDERSDTSSSSIAENSNDISIGTYEWRGHQIAYSESGSAGQKGVCLIHGFGASGRQYRNLIPSLSKQYKVYTLDLLGFGGSSKPKIEYSMDLYREQIEHFISEQIPDQERVHLVGNSIGSLASLMVASENSDKVESLILLNCAGGLNNKALSEDWRIKLAMPIFLLIDVLLRNETIGRYLFDRIREKENLRNILQSLYPSNAIAVDDELVDIIHGPSNDENALDVFVNIITTNNAGPSPVAIMDKVTCPMLLLWGTEDNLTPSDGPIGKYFQNLYTTREDTSFIPLEGVGHCPHDEASEQCLTHMLPWLEKYTS